MTENATFYVYLMSRLDGRPCYVGKGKGERWRHRGKYGRNKHLISIMRQAKALGQQLPCVKILENITEERAFEAEKALIAFFGREDLGTGMLVNLTDGGDGPSGYKHTAEDTSRRLASRGKYGSPSPESRALQSAAMKGRKQTPEHIANAASAQRGKKKSHGWWSTEEGRAKQRQNNHGGFQLGHQHSPEALEKIKIARANQTNVSGFKSGHQPSVESRAKMSASAAVAWARRKAEHNSQGEVL